MRRELERLEGTDREALDHVARMHSTLLPDSPIARLGPFFVRHFYYGTLVADNLVNCRVAYIGDTPVGFMSFTHRPSTFMAEGLRRHWLRLAGVLLWTALADPRRIGVMLWTFGLMRQRIGAPVPGEGEMLSFGVEPEFRGASGAQRTGRRISVELFDAARADLHALGVDRCCLVVRKENTAALAFYDARGCWVERDRASPAGTVVLLAACTGSDASGR